MALYFSLIVECAQEQDAGRISSLLKALVVVVAGQRVPMARIYIEPKRGLWHVIANPQGPGFSPFGYGEGLNEPAAIRSVIGQLYAALTSQKGIRRALCGYEAQDAFDDVDSPALDLPDLMYDRRLGRGTEAQEFGTTYYWNSPGDHLSDNSP